MSTTTKICAQTTLVPDNTPIPCDEFISSECIIHPDALVELGLPAESSAQAIFNAVLLALTNLNNQVGMITPGTNGVQVEDDDTIILNEALRISFNGNLSATIDAVDTSQVNVDAVLPSYTITLDASNVLNLEQNGTTIDTVDLSAFLDDTNAARIVSGVLVGTDLTLTRDDTSDFTIDLSGLAGGGGGIQSVVAGDNITVDNTDPANPIVNANGITAVGTPLINQVALFASDDQVFGDPNFTWDGNKFEAIAAGLGSPTTAFARFQVPGTAAEGIFNHVQIEQNGVEGLAGLLLSSSTEDWSLSARGSTRQGTFRLGRNGNVGTSIADTAFEVSRTDFTIAAPNVTTAAIDAANVRTYITREWFNANAPAPVSAAVSSTVPLSNTGNTVFTTAPTTIAVTYKELDGVVHFTAVLTGQTIAEVGGTVYFFIGDFDIPTVNPPLALTGLTVTSQFITDGAASYPQIDFQGYVFDNGGAASVNFGIQYSSQGGGISINESFIISGTFITS